MSTILVDKEDKSY